MTDFTGRVAQFQQSSEGGGPGEVAQTLQVWDFEIQHTNDAGDVDRTVSVQMVGRSFDGRIHNDEDVKIELPQDWSDGTTVHVDRIWSESRKVWVNVNSDKPSGLCGIVGLGVVLLLVIAVVAIFGVVGYMIVSHLPSGNGVGPSTSPSTAPSTATVPNVAGFDNVRAAQVLYDAGFEHTDQLEKSSTVPFGQVIRTDPPAGATAPRGSTVTVFISTGS